MTVAIDARTLQQSYESGSECADNRSIAAIQTPGLEGEVGHRQRQEEFYEFKATLVCIVNPKLDMAM